MQDINSFCLIFFLVSDLPPLYYVVYQSIDQLVLVKQDSKSNLLFPSITITSFWSHAYREVTGLNANGYNGRAVNPSHLVSILK